MQIIYGKKHNLFGILLSKFIKGQFNEKKINNKYDCKSIFNFIGK